MAEFIATTVANAVATVTLARPDLHNAFNDDMMRDLIARFDELGRRDDVRVIILAGEGKSFCAGADINWMKRMVGYTLDENITDANLLALMLRAIRESP